MILYHQSRKSPDFIFEYLTDVDKFVSIHPVITKMKILEKDDYLVYETLKVGFIPISFTYKTKIEANLTNKAIVFRVTVMGFTKIKMSFIISAANSFTAVEENIEFITFNPFQFILKRLFKKQHKKMFQNLEKLNY